MSASTITERAVCAETCWSRMRAIQTCLQKREHPRRTSISGLERASLQARQGQGATAVHTSGTHASCGTNKWYKPSAGRSSAPGSPCGTPRSTLRERESEARHGGRRTGEGGARGGGRRLQEHAHRRIESGGRNGGRRTGEGGRRRKGRRREACHRTSELEVVVLQHLLLHLLLLEVGLHTKKNMPHRRTHPSRCSTTRPCTDGGAP